MGGPSQEMWWPSSAKRVLRTHGKFLLHCSLVEMEKEEEELHSMVGRKVRDGSIVLCLVSLENCYSFSSSGHYC